MEIRTEIPDDFEAIRSVIAEAFGQDHEPKLVDDLRDAGDLVISLVAELDGKIFGHVALSRLQSPPEALALAPVAVSSSKQTQGIGSALICDALQYARELGSVIIFVLGEPSYYTRFGFSADTAKPFPCSYAGPYFMALWLGEARLAPCQVNYASAFDELE
ncbi:MAG: N-acetyltransferase [Rhodospirillales bacterium]|jgi:putative acetyltransferase|nr:N-acetyltransferase [Rhodospirillales bacterium]MDP6643669.1 N-acetyltransferase [Rhodospirillales bacterium]MDP6840272.1 N-acetyltransferase [Rhodospirillales bacterium]|tara:strand:+ start:874 stop:1356 length:483 start_codon:yes stop_codon:yes gene_type:complete